MKYLYFFLLMSVGNVSHAEECPKAHEMENTKETNVRMACELRVNTIKNDQEALERERLDHEQNTPEARQAYWKAQAVKETIRIQKLEDTSPQWKKDARAKERAAMAKDEADYAAYNKRLDEQAARDSVELQKAYIQQQNEQANWTPEQRKAYEDMAATIGRNRKIPR